MVPFAESSRRCHTAPRCTAIRFTCGGVMRRDHRAWPDERDESAVDGVLREFYWLNITLIIKSMVETLVMFSFMVNGFVLAGKSMSIDCWHLGFM